MEYQKVPLPGWRRELGTRYSAVSKATGNSTRVFTVSTEGKRERMKGVSHARLQGISLTAGLHWMNIMLPRLGDFRNETMRVLQTFTDGKKKTWRKAKKAAMCKGGGRKENWSSALQSGVWHQSVLVPEGWPCHHLQIQGEINLVWVKNRALLNGCSRYLLFPAFLSF